MSHAGPILCATALLLGGCYDSDFRTTENPSQPAAVTTTIARFNEALVEETPAITGDVVLSGVVTTSDEAGHFHRPFRIEEAGGRPGGGGATRRLPDDGVRGQNGAVRGNPWSHCRSKYCKL